MKISTKNFIAGFVMNAGIALALASVGAGLVIMALAITNTF